MYKIIKRCWYLVNSELVRLTLRWKWEQVWRRQKPDRSREVMKEKCQG